PAADVRTVPAQAVISLPIGGADTLAAFQLPPPPVRVATTTTLAATPNPVLGGSPVTLTATVSASSPAPRTGTVTFFDGALPLATVAVAVTTASFSTSALSIGTHTISASYSGDPFFLGSQSPGIAVAVADAASIGPTLVAGSLAGNITWGLAGTPYRLTGNVQVAAGATLTIDPGVVVEADNNWSLEVAGTIRAIGTAAQPITFRKTAASVAGWLGIRFLSSATPYDAAADTGS